MNPDKSPMMGLQKDWWWSETEHMATHQDSTTVQFKLLADVPEWLIAPDELEEMGLELHMGWYIEIIGTDELIQPPEEYRPLLQQLSGWFLDDPSSCSFVACYSLTPLKTIAVGCADAQTMIQVDQYIDRLR